MHRGRSLDVIVSAEIARAWWTQLVEPRALRRGLRRRRVDRRVLRAGPARCPTSTNCWSARSARLRSHESPRILLPRFSLRLLEMLGLAPPLTTCVRCGEPLLSGQVWLDAAAGGLVDGACRERWQELPELQQARPREPARARPSEGPQGAALRATPRAAAAVDELVAHHLGKRPKAVAAARQSWSLKDADGARRRQQAHRHRRRRSERRALRCR